MKIAMMVSNSLYQTICLKVGDPSLSYTIFKFSYDLPDPKFSIVITNPWSCLLKSSQFKIGNWNIRDAKQNFIFKLLSKLFSLIRIIKNSEWIVMTIHHANFWFHIASYNFPFWIFYEKCTWILLLTVLMISNVFFNLYVKIIWLFDSLNATLGNSLIKIVKSDVSIVLKTFK